MKEKAMFGYRAFFALSIFLLFSLFADPAFSQRSPPKDLCESPFIKEFHFQDFRWEITSRCENVSPLELREITDPPFARFLESIERIRENYGAFPNKNLYRYTIILVNELGFDVTFRPLQGTAELPSSPFAWIARDFAPLVPECSFVRIQFLSPFPPKISTFSFEIHIDDVRGWDFLRIGAGSIITPTLERQYDERIRYSEALVYFLEEIVVRPLTREMAKKPHTCSFYLQ